jgi:hypothetical protein
MEAFLKRKDECSTVGDGEWVFEETIKNEDYRYPTLAAKTKTRRGWGTHLKRLYRTKAIDIPP